MFIEACSFSTWAESMESSRYVRRHGFQRLVGGVVWWILRTASLPLLRHGCTCTRPISPLQVCLTVVWISANDRVHDGQSVWWACHGFAVLSNPSLRHKTYGRGYFEYIWSNYSDLTRPHPKWWFSKGNPLISGKSRLVKYYNLARYIAHCSAFNICLKESRYLLKLYDDALSSIDHPQHMANGQGMTRVGHGWIPLFNQGHCFGLHHFWTLSCTSRAGWMAGE